MIIIDLIYNLSILISISILAGFVEKRWKKSTKLGSIFQGVLFGVTAVIGMMNPFVYAPGIIFDGRSVVLSICGVFFGPIAASIAGVITLIYRTYLWGSGIYMGISVIITSTLIGISAYYFRKRKDLLPDTLFLFLMGLIVHVGMVVSMFLLPSTIRKESIHAIALTVLIVYPLATILIGKILYDQEERAKLIGEIIQNEKDTSLTLMSIGDAVIATDLQGRVTRMNKMAEKLTGCSLSQVKNHPLEEVFTIFSFEEKTPLESPINRVLETKEKVGIKEGTVLINRNGKEFHIADSAAPILDERGNIKGVILVFSDITNKFDAEKDLAKERNLLRTLIDNMPFSIYIKDINFRKLLVNKTELKFLNLPEEAVLGKDDFDLYPSDVAMKFHEDDALVIEKGQLIKDRIESIPLIGNKKRWISTTKMPWKDSAGNIIGLVGFGADISDKIEDEEKIKKLSEAVEQSPIALIITDKEGAIEYVNRRFIEMTGFEELDVIGKKARILKEGNLETSVHSSLWETILSKKKWKGEFYSQRKNGERYWESVVISPILNSSGEITNYILLNEDITERKSLINELIIAREKAVESDKLKSAFLANMSHEIRTPMNGILGFTELLKHPELEIEDQQFYLTVIEQSGQRLLNLINDIIDISKIEAGEMTLSMGKSSVNELIENEYQFFLSEAESKGLHLERSKELPDNQSMVVTDGMRLNQVLTNLIKNSLKFTQRGKISFGYLVKGDFLEFFVKDDGIGISAEMKEKIFERFHQGDLVLTKRYEGAGLGLSISKAIIELLGGKIWVEDNIPQGSHFKFTIPYKNAENIG